MELRLLTFFPENLKFYKKGFELMHAFRISYTFAQYVRPEFTYHTSSSGKYPTFADAPSFLLFLLALLL